MSGSMRRKVPFLDTEFPRDVLSFLPWKPRGQAPRSSPRSVDATTSHTHPTTPRTRDKPSTVGLCSQSSILSPSLSPPLLSLFIDRPQSKLAVKSFLFAAHSRLNPVLTMSRKGKQYCKLGKICLELLSNEPCSRHSSKIVPRTNIRQLVESA